MNPAAQNPHVGAPRQGMQKPGTVTESPQSMHTGVQFGPVGRWWDDKSVVRTIGLTNDQQRRMDTIFNANKPAILATYQTYLKEQAKLNALSHNPQATQADTFAAIDAVAQARTALQKATAQVYLQIRQQMSPDQIEKLGKLP
jgi:Spy/CpxP family protein refolding chaperone